MLVFGAEVGIAEDGGEFAKLSVLHGAEDVGFVEGPDVIVGFTALDKVADHLRVHESHRF